MTTSPTNGTDRQSRGALGNLAYFLRDLVALIELQAMLFVVDAQDGLRKARAGLLLLVLFGVLGVSCLPLALAGLAWILAESTHLTVGQALLCVAVSGMFIACLGVYLAARQARPTADCLRRSRNEWQCNVAWVKTTLKQLGDGPRSPDAASERMRGQIDH